MLNLQVCGHHMSKEDLESYATFIGSMYRERDIGNFDYVLNLASNVDVVLQFA